MYRIPTSFSIRIAIRSNALEYSIETADADLYSRFSAEVNGIPQNWRESWDIVSHSV